MLEHIAWYCFIKKDAEYDIQIIILSLNIEPTLAGFLHAEE